MKFAYITIGLLLASPQERHVYLKHDGKRNVAYTHEVSMKGKVLARVQYMDAGRDGTLDQYSRNGFLVRLENLPENERTAVLKDFEITKKKAR